MISAPVTDPTDRILGAVLRYDRKQNTYKLALVRALNDAALAYPDLLAYKRNVAVPLRILAASWIAYYWAFADPRAPVYQGNRRTVRSGGLANDVEFRPALTRLRQEWEQAFGAVGPGDGFLLTGDMAVRRRQAAYPQAVRDAFLAAVRAVIPALAQPIRYAGPGEWQLFPRPQLWSALKSLGAAALPGTADSDSCLLVRADLWGVLVERLLWIEALTVHQWALFTETVAQDGGGVVGRGTAYTLLTERPENRRPLTWERNRVDLLLLEGQTFHCPWTGRRLQETSDYDLDHIVPLAVYPMKVSAQ